VTPLNQPPPADTSSPAGGRSVEDRAARPGQSSATLGELHVVLPNDIDDSASPSGGNRYDRELCAGLTALGWTVREHAAYGAWPRPTGGDLTALGGLLDGLPSGALALVDGLVASAAPEIMAAHAARLRLVLLVHMPFGDTDPAARPAERRALHAATAIIVTGGWTRRRLAELYDVPTQRIAVATPGVEPAPVAAGTGTGGTLLCVAVVGPHKGHDVLVEALTRITDLPWTCICAGATDREPEFVRELRRRITDGNIGDRLHLAGPRTGADLDALYAAADLLVHPSRGETYGMVAAEALARGIPVLTTTAKGLPDAIGRAPGITACNGATSPSTASPPVTDSHRTAPAAEGSTTPAAADSAASLPAVDNATSPPATQGASTPAPADHATTPDAADSATIPPAADNAAATPATHGAPSPAAADGAGAVPGILIPPDDPDALADALRRWLTDPDLRAGLREAALRRRTTLTDWSVTARTVSNTLRRVRAGTEWTEAPVTA
jgi:glycosyltransferase involved in cell wall biosynthesis